MAKLVLFCKGTVFDDLNDPYKVKHLKKLIQEKITEYQNNISILEKFIEVSKDVKQEVDEMNKVKEMQEKARKLNDSFKEEEKEEKKVF